MCCHEQAKQHAVLLQKVQFMQEQVDSEREQAKKKEAQYDKIIAALKQTAEENAGKKQAQQPIADSGSFVPQNKDWNDTLDELNKKKDEVNSLQEKVLELELRAEKVALDHKLRVQQKDDEISEERLKFKHKESDLR